MVFVAFESSEEAGGEHFVASVLLEDAVHLIESY